MSDLVIITRPEADGAALADELKGAGFECFSEPMLSIEPAAFTAPDVSDYQALIFTSANAVRVFSAASDVRDIPVFCVGPQTAQEAAEGGYIDVRDAGGDADDLVALIAKELGERAQKLLYLRAKDTSRPLDEMLSAQGFDVDRCVVYEAKKIETFSQAFLGLLDAQRPMAVTFFSRRTAENFIALAKTSQKLDRLRSIKALCISEAVLKCVQNYSWAGTYSSKTPDRDGMVQLLKDVSKIKGRDRMTKNNNADAIENAEEIIERFGGIRPMAKKIDVAVTTIQGWKKRNTIPAARRDQVIEAADEHNIDLSDIIEGAPVILVDSAGDKAPPANENSSADRADEKSAGEKQQSQAKAEAETKKATPPITTSGSVPRSDRAAPRAPVTTPPPVESNEDLAARLAETEQKAVSKSTWINVFLILVAVGAVLALIWPESKGTQGRINGLESDVNGLRSDVSTVKEEQSFLSTIIPKDLDERIASLQEQAQQAKETAGAAVDRARAVSADVLSEEAGTLEQRMANLQTHMGDLLADPRFEGLKERFDGLNNSLLGQQQLNESVSELSALMGGFQGEELEVNEALDAARQQSTNLGQTFDGVPSQDLKAAALLLGMTQFRQSLNRDNQPFEDDLQLLQKLVGEENAELTSALERLAPRAEEGVLTPGGLTGEFKTIAGDVVVSSLKGEDVSFKERASARMNELFQVEKDGELVTGTPTQATVTKANNMLEEGDIAGAIAEMQNLEGEQAEIAKPWIDEAQATLMAQQLEKFMSGAGGMSLDGLTGAAGEGGGSGLVQDKDSGINIYKPATRFKSGNPYP